MREYSAPVGTSIPTTGNLTDDLLTNAESYPNKAVFSVRGANGWHDVTTSDFLDVVRSVAKGLIAAGVGEGDRVAILSKTRYEWTLFDYAIWFAGAVTVPIYETSSSEQVEWILADSGTTAVVAETEDHVNRLQAAQGREPLNHVWCIDRGAVENLRAGGRGVSDDEIEARRAAVLPDSPATVIYTSGATGRPKGCVLTHANFMVELGVAVEELPELFDLEDASTLLLLPLAHVFARIIQIGAVKSRVRLGYAPDIQNVLDDLQEFRPTFILAVPRVFEKLFNTTSQNAAADGRTRLFEHAAETAIAYSKAMDARGPGRMLRIKHALFDRLVYRRLRAALGGRCRYAVSGGAPLGERLGHFFRGTGLTVLEGFGLTETTGAITVNRPTAAKIGSVGRPLAGTTVRVASDGELLVRGGQVFSGYWGDPKASSEVLTADGWLRTGDLGEIDNEGFLYITGRKNEILVTAGGKNVAPSVLEERVRSHPLVSQCMVVGDGEPYIAALVTIDSEAYQRWAAENSKSDSLGKVTADPDLRAQIQAAIDDANKAVSRAESIRRFTVLVEDWTEERGQLTPSLKLKRNVVLRQFRREVEALFAS